jgi:hypothetical protein
MFPSVFINVLLLSTILHLLFLLFSSCFRINQLLRLQVQSGRKAQLVLSLRCTKTSSKADRQRFTE